MEPRKPHNAWSDAERAELKKGWDGGESYSGIALRLTKAFGRKYTRNMVARQCRDQGLVRGKGHIPQSIPAVLLLQVARGLPRRPGQRRRSTEVQEERRRRARIREARLKRSQEICILRENGKSIREIASMYGMSDSAVRWQCLIGGAMPGAGTRPSVIPAQMEAKIVSLREMGLTVSQISRETGVGMTTVRYRLAVDAARAEVNGWG